MALLVARLLVAVLLGCAAARYAAAGWAPLLTSWCPLCDDDQLLLINEGINHVQYIRMVELLQEVHFFEAPIPLFRCHPRDLQTKGGDGQQAG